jgi:hypothetical protein
MIGVFISKRVGRHFTQHTQSNLTCNPSATRPPLKIPRVELKPL